MRSLSLIRPDERREIAAAFVAVALVMAAHALLETARDTLFLTNLPPSHPPWVYLAIARLALLRGAPAPRSRRRATRSSSPICPPVICRGCISPSPASPC